jgi:hypothetical protein
MTTTTIAAPTGRAAPLTIRPQPTTIHGRTRTSPTLTRSELRRLVLDLLG